LERRDGERIVVAFDMRFLLASLLLFSSLAIYGQDSTPIKQPKSLPHNKQPDHDPDTTKPNSLIENSFNNYSPCTKQSPAKEPNPDERSKGHGFEIIAVVLTGIAAIAVIAQVWAYFRKERAWMVAIPDQLPEECASGQVLRVVFHIRNMGKTPAILTAKGERRELELPAYRLPEKPMPYENQIAWENGAILPPQGEVAVLLYVYPLETVDVYNGNRVLWIHGFVQYRDVFRIKRETRYCFRYRVRLGGTDVATVGWYPDGPAAYNKAT